MSGMNEKSEAVDVANVGAKEPFQAKIIAIPDEVLPVLTESQIWCCSQGCGETVPTLVDHSYFEVREADSGQLLYARKGKVWVSNYCGAQIELFDEAIEQGSNKGAFIEWKPTNAAEVEEAAYK